MILNVGDVAVDFKLFKANPQDSKEFESGWEINALSFLRIALDPGSGWSSSTHVPFFVIIIDIDKAGGNVKCQDLSSGNEIIISIKDLIRHYTPPALQFEYAGPIEYGCQCCKCGKFFEHQKKTAIFECWACRNNY